MIPVYVESGRRRWFAGAIEWPGWCRSAKDEASALESMLAYLPRYRRALGTAARGIGAPRSVGDLDVVERLMGDTGTDFGIPSVAPAADDRPLEGSGLRRQLRVLDACWVALDTAAEAGRGHTLTTGPRGGGRSLAKIVAHVDEADRAYLYALGAKAAKTVGRAELREALAQAIRDRSAGLVADTGPRGGRRWSARYGIRRAAWHLLDHAWEIEDRAG